jgi:hypothetical protein
MKTKWKRLLRKKRKKALIIHIKKLYVLASQCHLLLRCETSARCPPKKSPKNWTFSIFRFGNENPIITGYGIKEVTEYIQRYQDIKAFI